MQNLSLQDIFLNNLKFYRKRCGLSQEALSEKLNKGVNYINRIESHASFPTIQVIEEIAEILGIKASQLFEDDVVPQNIISSDRDKFVQDITEKLYEKLTADMKSILERI
ncbi:MAG: helix-turn-helix transcriptional regulator [Treponema sp.]|nr:helix-turn-helix transcriptional regulator [Treponema sp.]